MDFIENKVDKTSKEEAENMKDSQEVFCDESLNMKTEKNDDNGIGSSKISANMEVDDSSKGVDSKIEADMDASYSKINVDKSNHLNAESSFELENATDVEQLPQSESSSDQTVEVLRKNNTNRFLNEKQTSLDHVSNLSPILPSQVDDTDTDYSVSSAHTSFHTNTDYTELIALSETVSTLEDDEVSLTVSCLELEQLFKLEKAIDVEKLPLNETSLNHVSNLLALQVDQNVISNVPTATFNYGSNAQTENAASKHPHLYPAQTSANYNRKKHLNVLKWLHSIPDPLKNYPAAKRRLVFEEENEFDSIDNSTNELKKHKSLVYDNKDPSNRKHLVGLSDKLNAGKPKNESRFDHLLVNSPINDASKGLSTEEEKEDDKNLSE